MPQNVKRLCIKELCKQRKSDKRDRCTKKKWTQRVDDCANKVNSPKSSRGGLGSCILPECLVDKFAKIHVCELFFGVFLYFITKVLVILFYPYLTVLLFLFQCFDFCFCCHTKIHAHREPDLVHVGNICLLDLLTYINCYIYKLSWSHKTSSVQIYVITDK